MATSNAKQPSAAGTRTTKRVSARSGKARESASSHSSSQGTRAGAREATSERGRSKTSKQPAASARASSAHASSRASAGASKSSAASSRAAAASRASGRSRQSAVRGAGLARIDALGSYAERAVLIPVGAALIARRRLIDGFGEVVSTYSTSKGAEAQLRRFEQRGDAAREHLTHRAQRTRVRVERELRRRGGSLQRTVGSIDRGRASLAHDVSGRLNGASAQIERTVNTCVKDGTSLAGELQKRLLRRR